MCVCMLRLRGGTRSTKRTALSVVLYTRHLVYYAVYYTRAEQNMLRPNNNRHTGVYVGRRVHTRSTRRVVVHVTLPLLRRARVVNVERASTRGRRFHEKIR